MNKRATWRIRNIEQCHHKQTNEMSVRSQCALLIRYGVLQSNSPVVAALLAVSVHTRLSYACFCCCCQQFLLVIALCICLVGNFSISTWEKLQFSRAPMLAMAGGVNWNIFLTFSESNMQEKGLIKVAKKKC